MTAPTPIPTRDDRRPAARAPEDEQPARGAGPAGLLVALALLAYVVAGLTTGVALLVSFVDGVSQALRLGAAAFGALVSGAMLHAISHHLTQQAAIVRALLRPEAG